VISDLIESLLPSEDRLLELKFSKLLLKVLYTSYNLSPVALLAPSKVVV